ncbi:ABC transporter ATP-binding protein [Agrobacterium rhizogenes]|nr:ABC transporter ATP-binding protein [Rhizobium rhizogenes]
MEDLSLHVDTGEFVSILGPSGAGKSTIFQILTGATDHEAGNIAFDGASLTHLQDKFAFMPQRDALMPWRRIIDNATLGLEVQGASRAEARKRVLPLLDQFGLKGFENHYPAQLSGGMRQRVALLRTVVQERKMLLLDEPFGALDALTRTSMQRWLEGMWERHRWTALLITHDIREAIYLSDRIYVLSRRPAQVVREIRVPLPRRRNFSDLNSPAAAKIEADLLEALIGPDTAEYSPAAEQDFATLMPTRHS